MKQVVDSLARATPAFQPGPAVSSAQSPETTEPGYTQATDAPVVEPGRPAQTMTLLEAAAALSMTKREVKLLVSSGRLAGVAVGRTYRVSHQAVRAYLGAGETQGRERFVTVAEAASMMRVSKMTVYRLVHSAELPAVRAGRRHFHIPEQAVLNYIRAHEGDLAAM
jgi:excisionase family DNA binding protein